MSEFEKVRYTAAGSVLVGGCSIPYTATSENFPIRGETGELDATMFTFSYERSDLGDANGRPVLFGWNGGPGCGSLYVHMGLLSPMRLKCGAGTDMSPTAPFELVNNDNCLLDTCDVVAVDAIGTGYARLINQAAKEKYCSTQGDANAFASCIRQWLTAHRRWNSPIYIMGESYGTIRNPMVAESLFYSSTAAQAGTPIHISGMINLGSALNHGQEPFPIPDDVLNLPSIAAANWYWHPGKAQTLREYVDECDRFCYDTYVTALALGRRLPEEKRRAVAEKLREYTGYSVEKLLEDDLRVPIFRYPAEGMASEGRSIGIYDARFALGKVRNPAAYDYFADDASNAIGMPGFSAAFHGLWKERLGIDAQEEYVEIWNGVEDIWNFKTRISPITCLENGMHRNPKMKVMFGMGYYDMLTTLGWVRYLVSHYDLPEDRVRLRYYEAGHMSYMGDAPAAQLQADIKAFIND